MRSVRFLSLTVGAAALVAQPASAQAPAQAPAQTAAPHPSAPPSSTMLDSMTMSALRWRNVGPANTSGRVTDVEGIPSPSKTFYVAAAAGGIWKTTNAGTTFQPIFDNQRVISMGDLAIAPSDTNTIYAGTGEEDSRNSISPGGGIYKSTDGGKSWKLMGLVETQAIGRIVVHPTDPNTVYVAALGHVWGSNKERGLYKSTDGGQTWQMSKFISDKAGFVDVAMDPSDPNTLYASSWERVRGPYFLQSGGAGSALWKTTDAGKTWTEIKGNGFPASMKGRIGIAIARSNPKIVYTLVEADTMPNAVKDAKVKRQTSPSGLYRSVDGGANWTKQNGSDTRPFYYSQVRVDPKNPDRVYWSSTPVLFSDDGGKTPRQATLGIHVDHHAMWIDPNDPDHFIMGDDGGVSQTWDKGGNYDFMNQFSIAQLYAVSFDMAVPYRVCGGLQDNGSWCGPSRRKSGAITNAFWFTVGGGDGFWTAQDPTNPDIIYSESQGGSMGRLNYATGDRVGLVKPSWRTRYRQFEDSMVVARGDTTAPATPAVNKRLADLKTRAAQDSSDLDLRFNWNTPFFLSPHSPATFYAGGNRVLKSTNRGDGLYPISPDLSTRDLKKIAISQRTTGGITTDATGAETYGTVTALTESPIRPGLLYAGTDDGNVWLTRNDGATWENLTGRFAGVPARSWVSRVEASSFDSSTFYVAFDNHRENDFTPYVFVTTDYGRTFRPIANNLPTGGPDFVHVIREDPYNRDLLFVGTDVGAYVSLDRGASWQRFMAGLPTVPVHDLKIHPRDHEIIAATHGRGIWIADVAPLEQMRDSVRTMAAFLFAPKPAFQYGQPPALGETPGHKLFEARSPQYGAEIAYRLTSAANGPVRLVITDAGGDTLRTITGPTTPGLHRVYWDFRGKAPTPIALSPAGLRDSVVTARRQAFVFDSLEKAGMDKALIARARTALTGGGGFGGFGGGGGRGGAAGEDRFVARPGEGPVGGRGGAAGGQVEGAAEGPPSAADQSSLQEIARLINPAGGRGGGGGGGGGRGGQAPLVQSGDYLVTMIINGQKMKQVLRVERTGTLSNTGGFGFQDDDDSRDP